MMMKSRGKSGVIPGIVAAAVWLIAAPPSAAQNASEMLMRDGRLLFAPLLAPATEARVGAVSLRGEGRLRLDIGNSIDIVTFPISGRPGEAMSAGAEFFTWSSLRQTANFHFPVDAVDYLFGLTLNYMRPLDSTLSVSSRFRLSHISAHLVDGSYDKFEGGWRDGAAPRVYSREFAELTAAIDYRDCLRVYAGAQYVYHIDPSELLPWMARIGAEASPRIPGIAYLRPYAAYEACLSGGYAAVGNHSLQAGVKLGKWRGEGVNVFIAWYNGLSQHGEYHDRRWSYWGPGFTVDF